MNASSIFPARTPETKPLGPPPSRENDLDKPAFELQDPAKSKFPSKSEPEARDEQPGQEDRSPEWSQDREQEVPSEPETHPEAELKETSSALSQDPSAEYTAKDTPESEGSSENAAATTESGNQPAREPSQKPRRPQTPVATTGQRTTAATGVATSSRASSAGTATTRAPASPTTTTSAPSAPSTPPPPSPATSAVPGTVGSPVITQETAATGFYGVVGEALTKSNTGVGITSALSPDEMKLFGKRTGSASSVIDTGRTVPLWPSRPQTSTQQESFRESPQQRQPDPSPDSSPSARPVTGLDPTAAPTHRSEAPNTTTASVELSPAIMQHLERMRRSGKSWMRVAIRLPDGRDLRVKFGMRDGEVQVTFYGGSQSIRDELSQSWARLSDWAGRRGMKLKDPSFASLPSVPDTPISNSALG